MRALPRALEVRGAVSRSGRPFDPKALSRMLDDVADSSGRAVPRLRPAVFVPVENDAWDEMITNVISGLAGFTCHVP